MKGECNAYRGSIERATDRAEGHRFKSPAGPTFMVLKIIAEKNAAFLMTSAEDFRVFSDKHNKLQVACHRNCVGRLFFLN